MLLLLLSLLLPLFSLFLFHRINSKPKLNLPPGPRRLPIIGNLHLLTPPLHHSLYNLSKLHGPIFLLNLGHVPTLVVSSPSLAQQVLKTHDLAFCSRASLVAVHEYFFHSCHIAGAPYGDNWRRLRKIFVSDLFSSKKLHTFRFIQEEETAKMISSMKSKTGSAVNIGKYLLHLTNSIMFRVAFGSQEGGEYGKRSRFHDIIKEAPAIIGRFFVRDFFPGFGWVDEVTGNMRQLRRGVKKLDDFYQEMIDEHMNGEKRKELGDEGGDVLDSFLGFLGQGQVTLDDVKGVLTDVFLGGIDTASTITWVMAELARNPTVMRRAQTEVREAVGNKGTVKESDLSHLHYLKFIINETLRLHPPIPLLIPRETMQHCQINGYDIAPKTRVFVNVWAIGRDEDAWENPKIFNPDRFIGSSVDYRGQHFQFLPFGGGRRICLGLQFGIAVMEVALGNLLYAFDWELPKGMKEEDIDMEEVPGPVISKKVDLLLVAKTWM